MAGEQVLEEPLPIAKAGHQRVGLGQFAGDERAPAVRGWQAGIRCGQQLADLRQAEAGTAGKVDQRDAGQDRRGVAALATAPWRRSSRPSFSQWRSVTTVWPVWRATCPICSSPRI